MANRYNNLSGFTLVEILIVVVILGILAAMVIPQFANAAGESNLTNLKANLQTIRTQILMYKIEHNDLYPGQTVIGGDVTAEAFRQALSTRGLDGRGPYVNKFPFNPCMSANEDRYGITCVNDANAHPTGNEGTGWWFNAATGDFRACDSPEHINY